MRLSASELKCKEIVNIRDGMRLGVPTDVLLETPGGKIVALIAPGPRRMMGLLGREDDYVLPWECIRRIGDDIILIDVEGAYRREKISRTW